MTSRILLAPTLTICGVEIKSPASGFAIPVLEILTSTEASDSWESGALGFIARASVKEKFIGKSEIPVLSTATGIRSPGLRAITITISPDLTLDFKSVDISILPLTPFVLTLALDERPPLARASAIDASIERASSVPGGTCCASFSQI